MVRMHVVLTIVAVHVLSACAPMTELDEQDSTMKSRVDSLEIQLSECRTQSALFTDRLGAIERENLQIDDLNRKLSARLAELQFGDSLDAGIERDAAPEPVEMTPVTPPESQPTQRATSEAAASRTPDIRESSILRNAYASGITPDIGYLRAYQSALQAHNHGDHDAAFRQFDALLRKASPNDMADNCLFWMAETRRKSGHVKDAIELYSVALECVPSDKTASALLGRAQSFIEMDRSGEARHDLERLIIEFPSDSEAQEAARLLRNLR